MLVCMKCHIEFEEGTDFCPQCGGPLVAKEKPTSGQDELSKAEEKKTETRLICPKCKLLFERRETCIRCGAPLVKQTDLQEGEEQKSPEAPESKKEGPKKEEPRKEPLHVQPPRRQPVETPMEKPRPSYADKVEKGLPPPQPSARPSPRKLPEDMEERVPPPPAKGLMKFLRLPLGVLTIVILVAAGIYFFWSQYSYFAAKPSGPAKPTGPGLVSSEQATGSSSTSTPTDRTPPVAEPQEKVLSPSEAWEVEKIKELLEKIRRANFRKDIDLFMSCYSTDFKDREGRQRTTLKYWDNFNYLDLSYDIKSHSISGDAAKARVEWSIRIAPRMGGKAQESKTLLEVVLKKEDNDWKIKEVIPVS
jgi:ketosteroid isomerase-like protein/RNA polymerase subunit RPABC4/transcription elongation factor Spt4